jgi:hypothetical protein
MKNATLPIVLTALMSFSSSAGSARAGVKLGVTVGNAEGTWGARVDRISDPDGLGAALGLKHGDVIRYIRSDNNRFVWQTPRAPNLLGALQRTHSRVTVYYLRNGRAYKRTGTYVSQGTRVVCSAHDEAKETREPAEEGEEIVLAGDEN